MPALFLGAENTLALGVPQSGGAGITAVAGDVWTFNPDTRANRQETRNMPAFAFAFSSGVDRGAGVLTQDATAIRGTWNTRTRDFTLSWTLDAAQKAALRTGFTDIDGRPVRLGGGASDPFYFLIAQHEFRSLPGGAFGAATDYLLCLAEIAYGSYEDLAGGLERWTFTYRDPFIGAAFAQDHRATTVTGAVTARPGLGALTPLNVGGKLHTTRNGEIDNFVLPYEAQPRAGSVPIPPIEPPPLPPTAPTRPTIPTVVPTFVSAPPGDWDISATLGVSRLADLQDPATFLQLTLTPWVLSVRVAEGEGANRLSGRIALAGRYGHRRRSPSDPARVIDDFIAEYANDSLALTVSATNGTDTYSWAGTVTRLEYDEGREITRMEFVDGETEQSRIRGVRNLITRANITALSTFHSAQDAAMQPSGQSAPLRPNMAEAILAELDEADDSLARVLRTLHRYAIDVVEDARSRPSLIDYAGRLSDGSGGFLSVALGKADMSAMVRSIDSNNRPGVPNRAAPDNVWQYELRPLRLTRTAETPTSAEPEAITVPASGGKGDAVDLGTFSLYHVAAARIACARRVLSAEVSGGQIETVRFRPDLRPHMGIAFGGDVTAWAGGALNWRAGKVVHRFEDGGQTTQAEIIGGRF